MAIMSFAFLLVPLIYLLLPVWLFLLPLSRAYLAGLAFVRDPAIRVTPLDPWVAFDQTVHRKLGHARNIWIFLLIVSAINTLIFAQRMLINGDLTTMWSILQSFFSSFTSLFAMQLCCAWWAPRCVKTGALVTLSLATWIIAEMLLSLFALAVNIFSLNILGHLLQYALIFGLYVNYWHCHLRRNTRWFRFEE